MIPIYIIITTIVFTVALMEVFKWLYKYLPIFFERIRIKRERIARIDILWNSVKNMDNRLEKVEKTLLKVEVLAKNFDRDMDRYNANLNKDIAEILKAVKDRIVRLEKK